jgi:methylenetetrahydrofolate reductase (NADPH)
MQLAEFYKPNQLAISIEVFPPKGDDGDRSLMQTLQRLTPHRPAFFSCTYGAGGSTRNRTVEWCRVIQEQFAVPATAHFTCVGATREELLQWLAFAQESGIRNIMALRGDAPKGETEFRAVSGGLSYANELVTLIREHFPEMGIGVAGYPEKHPESPDPETDLLNLLRKVNAGADAVFTQLFYENANFFRFREACDRVGIRVPLIPGIMPITEFARIKRITSMCGAVFPESLCRRLEAVQDDRQAQFEIGVTHAIEQCSELIAQGVPGLHFYVLNRSQACQRILEALELSPPHVEYAENS